MPEPANAREQLPDIAKELIRYRFLVETLAAGLKEEEAADLHCILTDGFDPLLRGLLAAMGNPAGGQLLEAVFGLQRVEVLLQSIAEQLPRSPHEDEMLDGKMEPDEPTEIRTTISAVLVDQLRPAVDNLLHAMLYRAPGTGG